MKYQTEICCCVIAVVIVIIIVCMCRSSPPADKEQYSNIGGIDNVGAMLDDNYDLVPASETDIPAAHFADLVDSGDHAQQAKSTLGNIRPLERLNRVQGRDLMPRTSAGVTPYNIDVADPVSHSYMVNPPRVQLKDPNREMSLATAIRGDIPIRYHPNVSLVGRSRYGRDSLNLQGLFTPHFQALYNKYTGQGYRNMPVHVSNEEVVMDN